MPLLLPRPIVSDSQSDAANYSYILKVAQGATKAQIHYFRLI